MSDTVRQTHPLPIDTLFTGATRQSLLSYAAAHPDAGWKTKSELSSVTGCSAESIRKHLGSVDGAPGPLLRFCIFEPSTTDPEANIVRYRPNDSSVLAILQAYPHGGFEGLFALLESEAARGLVAWFLDTADPSQSYSKAEIVRRSSVSHTCVYDRMDLLIEHDFVETVSAPRGEQYRIAESDSVRYCRRLNRELIR